MLIFAFWIWPLISHHWPVAPDPRHAAASGIQGPGGVLRYKGPVWTCKHINIFSTNFLGIFVPKTFLIYMHEAECWILADQYPRSNPWKLWPEVSSVNGHKVKRTEMIQKNCWIPKRHTWSKLFVSLHLDKAQETFACPCIQLDSVFLANKAHLCAKDPNPKNASRITGGGVM